MNTEKIIDLEKLELENLSDRQLLEILLHRVIKLGDAVFGNGELGLVDNVRDISKRLATLEAANIPERLQKTETVNSALKWIAGAVGTGIVALLFGLLTGQIKISP